jgi:hypothetical protein
MRADERDEKVPRIGQTRGAAEAVAEKIVNTLTIISEYETNPTPVSEPHTPMSSD